MPSESDIPPGVEARLRRFFELHALGIDLSLAGLKHDHPQATPRELRQLLRERLEIGRKDKWRRHAR